MEVLGEQARGRGSDLRDRESDEEASALVLGVVEDGLVGIQDDSPRLAREVPAQLREAIPRRRMSM